MQYLLMVIIAIIIFPLAFLGAVKIRTSVGDGKKLLVFIISALVLVVIFILIPLTTSQAIFFNPAGIGFFISSLAGVILGLGGPYSSKR